MRKQQNFHKKPHTARWLMTFHTAGSGLPADLPGSDAPEAREERAAMDFVTGGTAVETMEIVVWDRVERRERTFTVRKGYAFATEKQAKFALSIAVNRQLPNGATVESLAVRLEQGFAKAAISQFIDRYRNLPEREATAAQVRAGHGETAPVSAPADPEVPAGRYAIVVDGVTKFYRVTVGRAGSKWAGRRFVEAQASDEMHPVRNPTARTAILKAIEADEMSERRYGIELGVCGRCGRTLTDEESRAYGIGPVCRGK